MNDKLTQSTQLKLLEVMSGIEMQKADLAYIKETHYLGGYAYDLGEVIGKLEVALKCLKFDVLKLGDNMYDCDGDCDSCNKLSACYEVKQ